MTEPEEDSAAPDRRRAWTPLPGHSTRPTSLRDSLDHLASTWGLTDVDSVTALFVQWHEIVGEDLAARCKPTSLREGLLTIQAVDQQWATELKWMTALLSERCCATLGEGAVTDVRVTY